MSITLQQLESSLADYTDPYLKKDVLSSKLVHNMQLEGSHITLQIRLSYPAAGIKTNYETALTAHLNRYFPGARIQVSVDWQIIASATQASISPIKEVKNVIAIASGKGGVGKSTVTVNLALALLAEGARVGILDADIYGPSQPTLLGVSSQSPESKDQKHLEPVMAHGIQSMSIGYLIEQDTPMIWRGPMVSGALQQLLNDTRWRQLDYLLIDLPPGTGDIQLTLSQKIPVSGAIIVTTPQDLALLDARKAIGMFQKVRVPVLGVIENMSTHVCSQCGHVEAIFGEGGASQLSSQYATEMLGALPLATSIRKQADAGCPTVVADPESEIAATYREIARRVAATLALQTKARANPFPAIVIERE